MGWSLSASSALRWRGAAFSAGDGAGAGGTADGEEALIMERVHRHAFIGTEGRNLIAGPIEERRDLDEAPPLIPRDEAGIAAGAGV